MTARLYKFPPIGECDSDERVYHIPSRDERPNLIDALAAENAQRDVALHLKRLARQAKWRGRFELAVMVAVAVFLGFAIAVQL